MGFFIYNFMQNRIFQIKVANTKSTIYTQEEGVPQGSVLSVTLFTIAINGIIADIPKDVGRSLYVDDLAIYYSASNINHIERKLQVTINKINNWSKNHGYRLSNDKTIAVHFHRRRGIEYEPSLLLNNQQVKFDTKAKFLGIYLDQRLRWAEHIKYLKQKTIKRMNLLKTLSHLDWGADRKTLLRLYDSLIRSKIDYGSHIYATASEHLLLQIRSVHNQAIRLCTGAFRSSPVPSLYAESGEPPLDNRRNMLGFQHYIRIQRLPDTPLYTTIMNNDYRDVYRNNISKAPLGIRMEMMVETLNLSIQVLPYHPPFEPPWRLPDIVICRELTLVNKKDFNPEYIKLVYEEHINFYHRDSINIYTDGSKMGNGVGCAYFTQYTEQSFKLDINSSIFTAELYAILKVVQMIENSNHRNFTILTDSKSAMQAIADIYSNHPIVTKIQSWIILLQTRHKTITFCWIPSHVNIPGNENADKLAKQAATMDGGYAYTQYPCRDYYPIIRKMLLNVWQQEWFNINNNKLRTIKETVKKWPSSFHKERKVEVVLTRLRIGHTRLTHGHLMERRHAPYCDNCIVPLTVKHIITECPDYNEERLLYFGNGAVTMEQVLGETPERLVEIKDVINFLKDVNVLDLL